MGSMGWIRPPSVRNDFAIGAPDAPLGAPFRQVHAESSVHARAVIDGLEAL
jgi:hypothetical protein